MVVGNVLSRINLLRVLFNLGVEVQCVSGEHVQGEVGGGGDLALPAGGIHAFQGTFF